MCRGEDLSTLKLWNHLKQTLLDSYSCALPSPVPLGLDILCSFILAFIQPTDACWAVIARTDIAASNSTKQERQRYSLHRVPSPVEEERHHAST